MLGRWTRVCLRFRWPIVVFWTCVTILGAFGWTKLGPLQSNTFTVPGTDSERVRSILERRYGDRSDGSFMVVFQTSRPVGRALLVRLQQRVDRAARAVPTGKPTQLLVAPRNVVYGEVLSTLNLAEAKGYTDDLRAALGRPRGARV